MGNGRKRRKMRSALYFLTAVFLAVAVPLFYVGLMLPAHATGGTGGTNNGNASSAGNWTYCWQTRYARMDASATATPFSSRTVT